MLMAGVVPPGKPATLVDTLPAGLAGVRPVHTVCQLTDWHRVFTVYLPCDSCGTGTSSTYVLQGAVAPASTPKQFALPLRKTAPFLIAFFRTSRAERTLDFGERVFDELERVFQGYFEQGSVQRDLERRTILFLCRKGLQIADEGIVRMLLLCRSQLIQWRGDGQNKLVDNALFCTRIGDGLSALMMFCQF